MNYVWQMTPPSWQTDRNGKPCYMLGKLIIGRLIHYPAAKQWQIVLHDSTSTVYNTKLEAEGFLEAYARNLFTPILRESAVK